VEHARRPFPWLRASSAHVRHVPEAYGPASMAADAGVAGASHVRPRAVRTASDAAQSARVRSSG